MLRWIPWMATLMMTSCSAPASTATPAKSARSEPAAAAAGPEAHGARAEAATKESASATPSEPLPDSIGSARMKEDGTLVLHLRAQTGDAVGQGYFEYAPDHAEYASIREHVGPIAPGEERPVPPFPESSDEAGAPRE